MKRTLTLSCLVAVASASAIPTLSTFASAQGFAAPVGVYEEGYDHPLPPRPVPGFHAGATETVVTTTRRVVTSPPVYDGYGAPPTVVTTRRVARPAPVIAEELDDGIVVGGNIAHPLPPVPVRRVVKSEVGFIPEPVLPRERVVTTRRVLPEQPVVIEERRVETTRRIVRPSSTDWAE